MRNEGGGVPSKEREEGRKGGWEEEQEGEREFGGSAVVFKSVLFLLFETPSVKRCPESVPVLICPDAWPSCLLSYN